MASPSHDHPSPDVPDPGAAVKGGSRTPLTTKLLRENAGRFFTQILDLDLERSTEKQGDAMGPFQLCELLGEGGFGNVWRAEQSEPVRREVAVKVIKLGMDSKQVLERFAQERQALASMDHPSIASMIEAGLSPDGRPYFAMELVRGDPITLWCNARNSPLEERLHIFQQVCLAVQHAHQKGVIHRDLKPSNILVTLIDARPVPKVIDFGIAKAVHPDAMDRTLLTRADDIMGTPRYMSPEQIESRAVIDTRSDIYSLGVLLYELITGVLPYDPSGTADELKRLKCETSPPRPSTQIKTQKAPTQPVAERLATFSVPFHSVPPDLDWITMRALEADCARRYQTAAEFAADIQRFLDNEPVVARPPSLGYVTGRWIRRHRTVFAAACFMALAMIAGTSIALWQARVARDAQRTAEQVAVLARQAEKEAQTARHQAQQTASFLTGLLDRISQEVHNGRNPEALKAALAASNEKILALDAGPGLRIELLDRIHGIYATIGENKLAIPLALSRAHELARLHGPDSDQARAAELEHIKLVIDFGARATGPELVEDLLRRVEATGDRGSKFWMDLQRQLCRAWIKLDIPDKALAAARELVVVAAAQKPPNRGMVTNQLILGAALESAGKYDEALALMDEIRPRTDDPAHLEKIDERVLYILQRKKDFKRGAEILRKQLAEAEKEHGHTSIALVPVLSRLSEFESGSKDHDAAIAHCQRALDLVRAQVPANDSAAQNQRKEIWQVLLDLADRKSSGGLYRDAIEHTQEALRIASQMENEQMITRTMRDLGDFYRDAGDFDLAYETKRQSYERIRKSGANLRDSEQDLREMCQIRLEQGRPDEALKVGIQLWSDVQARPESRHDIAHLGEIAESILKSYAALQATTPTPAEPEQIAAWRDAVATAKRLRKK
jgi:serine/threonine protein kinase/tetratricopeptide (TPR) repeat protein